MNASCHGADPSIIVATTCTIPSASFTQAPFNLVWGSQINATVTAVNNKGLSVTSEKGSGAVILTRPQAPLNLKDRPTITTSTQIGLIWDAVPVSDNGGTPVVSYSIFKAVLSVSNYYSTAATGLTTTDYIAEELVAVTTYSFKIQAYNNFDYSLDSLPTSILAAQQPDKPAPPTTSLSGTSLTIDWNAPNDQGKFIDYYII